MNFQSIFLLIILAVAFVLSVIFSGKGKGNCSGCDGDCSSCNKRH